MLGPTTKRRWHVILLCVLTLLMALPGLASLPVIDRDEARYAQASVQMAESGDWLNIRFQDEARNKKPAAAYWAQAAMIKAMGTEGTRKIWVQRIPSVLAALIAVLALYWGGLRLIGRQGAVIAAGLLALSLGFVFEAHIAKTDALLCASTTVIFAALARLRHGGGRVEVWAFWIALGASIMIKGPIGPALAMLSIAGLALWERRLAWAKPLLNIGAILVFILMWLPWAIAIFLATDGAFFIESLGNDFGGKLVRAQESHPGPPGYHLLVIWVMLWPSVLFLLPGLGFAVSAVKGKRQDQSAVTKAMRLCWVWVVPFWILIELMPTKLPHYALPLYPALCIMMAAAILAMMQVKMFGRLRVANAVLFLLISTVIVTALLYVQSVYGEPSGDLWVYAICAVGGLIGLAASFLALNGRIQSSWVTSGLAAIILSVGSYALILPGLRSFQTPERLAQAIRSVAPDLDSARIHSPDFTEPSFVYHIGQDVDLDGDRPPSFAQSDLIILDQARKDFKETTTRLIADAAARNRVVERAAPLKGFNYSEGDAVELVILREVDAPPSGQSGPDAGIDIAPDP